MNVYIAFLYLSHCIVSDCAMLNANHLTLPAGDMYNFESQHM